MISNTDSPNRQSVEATPLGDFTLSVIGSSVWSDINNIKIIISKLTNIWHQAIYDLQLSPCIILRLVIIASDIKSEVSKWSHELDEDWRVSSEGAVGQTMVWGNGKIETTYAIIIIEEFIAIELLDDSIPAKCTLVHELAHIYNDYKYIDCFGKLPVPISSDWKSIRTFLSHSTWAEYFAESITSPYYDSNTLNENVMYSVTLLKQSLLQIKDEANAYRNHRNLAKVWAVAVLHLSGVFNHIGRSLGIIAVTRQSTISSHYYDSFFSSINEISAQWGEVTRRLSLELNILKESQLFSCNSFAGLENIVDDGFRASGLEPYKSDVS